MNLARVCGNVVASHKYPSLDGYKLILIQPLNGELEKTGKQIIATDLIGAGTDELVFYVTSREASNTMENPLVPTDASILGIVDEILLLDKSKDGGK
ncbi:MAG: EutN/CcmL family microcompartment protein [Candidatus Wallbacteria bacterium]|nr:EutN/CcmL family microcompartment protein [Candidatus Wallbacteria bacterium]